MHQPTDSFTDTLTNFIEARLQNVYTGIPAVVTAVHLDRNCVDVQPLIRSKGGDEKQTPLPEVYDVPFQILSGDVGKFKITFPIRVNDTVMLHYSQRDLFEFYGSDGKTVVDSFSGLAHQSNPVFVTPCLFTHTNPTEVAPDAVVIQAGSSTIRMNEDGDIIITPSDTLIVNGNTVVNGNFSANGGSFTHNGVNVGDDHTHGGVRSGTSSTSVPN